MNNTPEVYFERLIELSQKKHAMLQEILELTLKQKQSLNPDELDELEKLLSARQELMTRIDKLDEAFNVYFTRLKSELRIKSLDELKNTDIKGAKQLQSEVAAIINLVGEICAIESENNKKGKEVLSELERDVKISGNEKKISNAYVHTNVQTSSYFIDKKK